MRQLYLVRWVGLTAGMLLHQAIFQKERLRSVVFRLDFAMLRDRAAALDYRKSDSTVNMGHLSALLLGSMPWLVG